MVNPKIFKIKIQTLLSQDYKVEFLGKNFDKIVNLITSINAEKLYDWIFEIIKKQIQPITIGSKKRYKNWNMNQLLVFRYPFNISNTEYRIIFVKVKNSIYVEFHLGNHKYYDKVRKSLNLK